MLSVHSVDINIHVSVAYSTSKWMFESQTELALKNLSLSQSLDTFSSSKRKREKYHIGMTLSEGNFAVVKQCEEKASEKELLLRVINKAKVFGREDLILREVTIMKMLRHENVMQVLDHWETTDDMYLVVEHIEVRRLRWLTGWSVRFILLYMETIQILTGK